MSSFKLIERTFLEMPQRVAGRKLVLRVNAFQGDQFGALGTAENHRIVEHRRNGNDVRYVPELFDQIPPVFYANAGIFVEDVDMRGGRQHIALQRVLESVVDGQGNDQGHHARRYPDHRNYRDHGDDFLLAARAKVTPGDE